MRSSWHGWRRRFIDADADHHAERAGHGATDQGPVLVGDAHAVQFAAGLAELVGERPRLRPGELEGLLDRPDPHLWPFGQNAAARARREGAGDDQLLLNATGVMSTVWPLAAELTVSRQRAPVITTQRRNSVRSPDPGAGAPHFLGQ
jgi:hypothetical protein